MAATYQKVDLGGKEYLLKFGFNAVADIEEYFGKGVSHVFNKEQMGFRTIRALYWAGMKWKYRITVEQVGELLEKELEETEKSLEDIMKPVIEAVTKAKIFKSKKKPEGTELEEVQIEAVEEDPNV